MKKYIEYLDVLINNGIKAKKDDKVLIVIPRKTKNKEVIKQKLIELLSYKEITDVSVCEDDDLFEDGFFKEAISERKKLILLTGEEDSKDYIGLLEDLDTYKTWITYTIGIAPSKNITIEDITNYSSIENNEKNVINWRIIGSYLSKRGLEFKNRKIGKIKINDNYFTDFDFETTGLLLDQSSNGNLTVIPNYSFVLSATPNTAKGFVETPLTTTIGDAKIEELRLFFKEGMVKEYDCLPKNADIAEKYLGKACDVSLKGLGFVDKCPITDAKKGNYVLDRYTQTYLLISSINRKEQNEKLIYVPITSGSLKIKGTPKQNSPEFKLFEYEELSKILKYQ